MSTQVSASNLSSAVRDYISEWSFARDHWRDVKAVSFQEKYLEKIPGYTTQARMAMEELNNVLRKVRQDCE